MDQMMDQSEEEDVHKHLELEQANRAWRNDSPHIGEGI